MSNPTILLVEDAPTDVLLAQRALKKNMIKAALLIAADGAEALQLLEAHSDISLILLDLHLPKINGLNFLEYVRRHEQTRSIPIVVVTSSELGTDRTKAMELGANGYIAKPLDPTKLKQMVEELAIEALKPPEEN
jgi:two-component system, response regulator